MSKLSDAMGGDGPSASGLKALASRLKNQLSATEEKAEKKDEKVRDMKEKVEETFMTVANSAETHGSSYLAALAEGYWGDKVRPKGISIAGVTGGVLEFTGLYGVYKGKGWASHVTSVGRGLVGAMVVSGGIRHGKAILDSVNKNKAGAGEKVEIPANAKPGDVFEVVGADGTKRKAIVVKNDDGTLAATFQGASNWRKVEREPTKALLSPGRRRKNDDDDDDDERPAHRGGGRRFPAARR